MFGFTTCFGQPLWSTSRPSWHIYKARSIHVAKNLHAEDFFYGHVDFITKDLLSEKNDNLDIFKGTRFLQFFFLRSTGSTQAYSEEQAYFLHLDLYLSLRI